MSECVKVVVRCRPMSTRENQMGCKNVITMDSNTCICNLIDPSDSSVPCKSFRFDGVYDGNSITEDIYNEVAYPLIEGVSQGYNCTVFAYGQTGCGKSFTMQGNRNNKGIITLALQQLFEAAAVTDEAKFLLTASFLEIHNEEIKDLLVTNQNKGQKLELREHPEKGVYVHDLSTHPVHSHEQCVNLLDKGWQLRSVGATLMNADSSRSHCIFSLNVERMDVKSNTSNTIRRGKLNLVDLAGSERQSKTGASGDRLKEATKINLSLSALGNVISALVDGRSKHIPYRDSKLTRLLQDSLGGNTKTLMIACLSPADYNYDETLSTLRYAHRAKSIENKPRVNEDPKDALLRQYQQEIDQLRKLISTNHLPAATTEAELKESFEQQVAGLKAQFEAEQRSKEQLQHDLENLRSEYNIQLSNLNEVKDLREDDDITMVSPISDSEQFSCGDKINLTSSQREVFARLQAIQASLVGGELAHDQELKEKRKRHLRAAERRLKALASALGRKDEEDAAVLQVYDDIEHELAAKGEALRRAKAKMKAFESEIKDLQREFETERTDYLETIRKQERQVKLFQQISSKMATVVKPECNYSDIEKIKLEAVWNDDTQKWKLPEVLISRTKLPPAGPSFTPPHNKGLIQPGGRAPSRTAPARIGSEPSSPDHENIHDTLMQKLERSEQENLAGNYFKPKRATELLIKAQEECHKNVAQQWKDAATRGKMSNSFGSSNGSNNTENLTPLQQAIAINLATATLNNSWAHAWTETMRSPELVTVRKPTRLEALPILDKFGNRKRAKAELNTMDVL